ncbi:D-alanyl-D-alanine carboxypeptidase family protein [Hathewaya limosa]|uniref:D-alanyl-D-alanine carboxypeptidase n=1 Tax=Hathewaya limosa TaxID=1536 RepID=A0ABU0JSK5_HATLI|nr:D-alanyl-D-alanine carboxypeptidase family protein [Hathewaya limosa]MDQ0479153.1 D-alanyl-D-alanine carboxypeptidase [Hathewaya limosa]
MRKKISALLLTLTLCFTTTSQVFASETKLPNLKGRAAISYDLDTKEVIYTRNIDQKVYPASITKMLTALVFAEKKTKTDNLKYTDSAFKQPPFSYRLNVHPVKVGDEISAENAMDALLLFSGNDIAYMIADNVGGGQKGFEKLMNDKAKELKMTNSHFITPNGLDDNTNDHYTTAYDLTKLAEASYNNAWVLESMSKKQSEVNFQNGNKALLDNRNKLVGKNGCIAGKTGYTNKAGRCLVALYERNGRHMVGVVMNSEYNYPKDTIVFEDMEKLMDYSYNVKKDVLVKNNSSVTSLKIPYKVLPIIGPTKTLEVPVDVKKDVTYYKNDLKPEKEYKLNNVSAWKLSQDKAIGKLIVTQKDSKQEYELYSKVSKTQILKDNILIYTGILVVLILIILGIVLLVNTIKKHSKKFY